MKTNHTLLWISALVGVFALIAATLGLLWSDGGQPIPFTTLHGESVQLYGDGLYRNDTVLGAVGYRLGDGFVLLAGLPLLLIALWLYARGSVSGGLLLSGALAYLLYTYSSLAFGAAYNNLFLIYITLTGLTLYGFVLLLMSFDARSVQARFAEGTSQRGIGIFLIVSGMILFCIWLLLSIVPALLAGTVPVEVASYTTIITFVWDMALIAPALVLSGILLLRREPLGYLLAPVMLVFTDVLGSSLLVMGIGQQLAGLMSVGQFIGFVVSFAILTLFSLGFTVALFRNFVETTAPVAPRLRATA
jgi:hypothetical protein